MIPYLHDFSPSIFAFPYMHFVLYKNKMMKCMNAKKLKNINVVKNDSMSNFLKQNLSQKWSWVWEMVLICF